MKTSALALGLALTALAGCVEPVATVTPTVPVSQAQTQNATIIGVRQVAVPNQANQVAGAVAGGLIGGLVGNQFGQGTGRDVMTVAGAVGGAAAGSAAARSQSVATEWTVRLDDGRTFAIVQDGNFRVGQRVQLVTRGNTVTIVA
jgi:outer membrane lipoprotein SlyB